MNIASFHSSFVQMNSGVTAACQEKSAVLLHVPTCSKPSGCVRALFLCLRSQVII